MRSTTTRVAGVYAAVLVITVSTAAAAVGIPAIAIDNFGQVDAGYFRGAQPQGDDYAALARLGVRAVLNLTSDDADPSEEVSVARNGMVYLHLPMNTRVEPTVEQLRTFLAFVNDPSHQPVYVQLRRRAPSDGCDDGSVQNDARRLDGGSSVQGNEAVQVRC